MSPRNESDKQGESFDFQNYAREQVPENDNCRHDTLRF